MIDLSKLELTEAVPWTPEEEIAEANAWGYDSVEGWLSAMSKQSFEELE